MLPNYKDHSVNSIQENNSCLQLESYKTHKYKLQICWLLKQVGHKFTIGI
jgi:hypothetical protein